MNKKQALAILNVEGNTQDDLKKAYRKTAMEFHPDKQNGNLEMMKLVNRAYEVLKFSYWGVYDRKQAKKETPLTETMQAIINQLLKLKGLKVEIIGSWLWVSGETRKNKIELKKAGMRYSLNKNAWYYHETEYRKKNKKMWDMDEIRDNFGSEIIRSSDEKDEIVEVTKVTALPADMQSILSLNIAYRRGGMEAVDRQCQIATGMLGPRPAEVTIETMLTEFNGT